MDNRATLTGTHFPLGDVTIAEGAIAVGCTFSGGYPITPSTGAAERMAQRLPQLGGIYAQMEDELARMAAIIAHPGAQVVVAGFSCSHQIEHFTERRTRHIAQASPDVAAPEGTPGAQAGRTGKPAIAQRAR